MVCSGLKNHIALVNKVFPTKVGEEGPKSSDLSYLLFYVKSKPHKLSKVFAYLEKRVTRDLYKQKTGYVKVSLSIIASILMECHQHLKLFACSVLRIINAVLGSPDPELLVQATTLFVSFNSVYVHDGVADSEFTVLFSSLIKTFALYSSYDTKVGATKQK
jgi:hypothetical protein